MLRTTFMPLPASLLRRRILIVATLTIFIAYLEHDGIVSHRTTNERSSIVVFPETPCLRAPLESFEIVVLRVFLVLRELVEHR